MRFFHSAPSLVDVGVTNRCNLKCDYCSVSSSPNELKEDELSLQDFKNLFQDLSDMNIHRISLTGGEPFVREDFFEILNLTQKHRFAKVINSNGVLITDSIARKLSEFNFDRICITMDGSSPSIHDVIRGDGNFKKTIKGIKSLMRYNLPVSTLFTLNKTNVHDLIPTIKLNEMLGIRYMSVMVVCPTGRASDGNILADKDKWYPVFLKLSEMRKNGDIRLNFKIVPPNESSVFWLFYFPLEYYNRLDLLEVWGQNPRITQAREVSCTAGISSCSIAHNGDVYGCELMTGINELKAGSIKENSIKDIWENSFAFLKLREITFDKITGKCKSCPHKWCGGGCRSASFNLTGSKYGSDESCFFEERIS